MQSGAIREKSFLLKVDINLKLITSAVGGAQAIRECSCMILSVVTGGIALAMGGIEDTVLRLLNYVAHVKE